MIPGKVGKRGDLVIVISQREIEASSRMKAAETGSKRGRGGDVKALYVLRYERPVLWNFFFSDFSRQVSARFKVVTKAKC